MKKALSFLLAAGLLVSSAHAESVWTPREAPAVRTVISDEEKRAREDAILQQGTLLFSGFTNMTYNAVSVQFLKDADTEDVVAFRWACDDVSHGGWGVLGLSVNGKQKDIAAYTQQPDKERLYMCTVGDLMEQAGVASSDLLNRFSIGAWNGGRIAKLYFLQGDAAAQLKSYLASVEETEMILHTYTGELSNKNAIPEAKKLYEYLKEIWQQKCLTGQMESTWMGSPDYEMDFLLKHTGKLPAIRGLDFMHNDFAGVARRAREWWEKGGIPHICWHTGPDFASAYNESQKDDLNWDKALTPGTAEYEKLLSDMDRAVPYLKELMDAGVPVLWRPFHELDGGWFWWSRGGSEGFVKLWQLMYSRYTDYWGLNNLIWVLGYSHAGGDQAAWYPGDDYVDLIGGDSYTPGANGDLYADMQVIAPEGMPIVFHECGSIPTEAEMQAASAPWLMFMVWHTSHLTDGNSNTPESLHAVYNSDYFITLDELPAFR